MRPMWPSNPKTGSQLTYGVCGNGTVTAASPSLPRPRICFPRFRAQAPQLHLIDNSTYSCTRPTDPELQQFSLSVYNSLPDPKSAVLAPENVVAALAVEAAPFTEGIALDPTIGPLTAVLELGTGAYADRVRVDDASVRPKAKNNVVGVQAAVFVTACGSVRVAPLLPKKRNVFHAQDAEQLQKWAVDTLPPNAAAEFLVGFPIKQVAVSKLARMVAVRGENQASFHSVEWSNRPGQKGVRVSHAFSIANTGRAWAQLVFSGRRFAFVDVAGDIETWTFDCERGTWTATRQLRVDACLYAPLDWSHWKRVCWPEESDYCLLFSRNSAHYVVLDGSGVVRRLVTTHYWSHLQDVAIHGDRVFLLTTKEVIWLRTTRKDPCTRLISWKHYLDDTDPSTKLALCPLGGGRSYALSVYSLGTPVVLTYTFGFVDARPCSLRDPYVLFISADRGVAHLALFESSLSAEELPLVNCLAIGPEANVTVSTFCGSNNRRFRALLSPVKDAFPGVVASSAPNVFTSKELTQLFRKAGQIDPALSLCVQQMQDRRKGSLLTCEADRRTQVPGSQSESQANENVRPASRSPEQIDMVQNYAFELGSNMNKLFDDDVSGEALPRYYTLASIAEIIPTEVTDLVEFDSMLHQLKLHCAEQGGHLDFRSMCLLGNFGGAEPSELFSEQLYSFLKEFTIPEASGSASQKAAVVLASCLIRAYSVEMDKRVAELAEEELANCAPGLRDIFGFWEGLEAAESRSDTGENVRLLQNSTQSKKGLLQRALVQSSQAFKAESASPKEETGWDLGGSPGIAEPVNSQGSQASDALFMTQFASQDSFVGLPSSSQVSMGSQSIQRRKKKRRGGFA